MHILLTPYKDENNKPMLTARTIADNNLDVIVLQYSPLITSNDIDEVMDEVRSALPDMVTEYEDRTLYNGYWYKVEPDEDDMDNPRGDEQLGTMTCFHKQYDLGDGKGSFTPESLIDYCERPDVISLPLYLYDHSGISMSTRSFIGRAHHAEWDSGMVGYIHCTKQKAINWFTTDKKPWKTISQKRLNTVLKELIEEVKEYDRYLRGEQWLFTVYAGDEEILGVGGFPTEESAERDAKFYIDTVKQLEKG